MERWLEGECKTRMVKLDCEMCEKNLTLEKDPYLKTHDVEGSSCTKCEKIDIFR